MIQVAKMPKKTLDVQVTTMDAVLEFSIDVSASSQGLVAKLLPFSF